MTIYENGIVNMGNNMYSGHFKNMYANYVIRLHCTGIRNTVCDFNVNRPLDDNERDVATCRLAAEKK